MVGWMTNQVRSGHMVGSMMWSNPGQMRATCEQWMMSGSETNGFHVVPLGGAIKWSRG